MSGATTHLNVPLPTPVGSPGFWKGLLTRQQNLSPLQAALTAGDILSDRFDERVTGNDQLALQSAAERKLAVMEHLAAVALQRDVVTQLPGGFGGYVRGKNLVPEDFTNERDVIAPDASAMVRFEFRGKGLYAVLITMRSVQLLHIEAVLKRHLEPGYPGVPARPLRHDDMDWAWPVIARLGTWKRIEEAALIINKKLPMVNQAQKRRTPDGRAGGKPSAPTSQPAGAPRGNGTQPPAPTSQPAGAPGGSGTRSPAPAPGRTDEAPVPVPAAPQPSPTKVEMVEVTIRVEREMAGALEAAGRFAIVLPPEVDPRDPDSAVGELLGIERDDTGGFEVKDYDRDAGGTFEIIRHYTDLFSYLGPPPPQRIFMPEEDC